VHALNAFVTADIARFADNSSENTNDWRAGFDGRFDIDRSMNLSGGFKYEDLHEDRSSPDQTGAAEPVPYTRLGPQAKLTKRFNRLNIQLGGELLDYNYDDVPTRIGTTLDMDDRDRMEGRGTVRLGYKIGPRYEAFVRGEYNNRNYDDSADDNGVDRDSKGWETVAGVAIDFGGITFGNVFLGYLRQEFDDPALPNISGLSFGGDLTWNITRLTTVKLAASRTVEETTLSGAAGAFSSRAGVTVDHELLRNLILSAEAEYRNNDYKGIDREDDIGRLGIGANYLLNRYLKLQVHADHIRRESNAVDGDYSSNRALIRIVSQY
jgi:hypothetical protein